MTFYAVTLTFDHVTLNVLSTVLQYRTGYQTVWEIRPSVETPSSVHWRRFYFQLTHVHTLAAGERAHHVQTMFISLQGAEWYGTNIYTGLMCTGLISLHSRRSPLCSSWRPRRPSHHTSYWQPGILRRWSCDVEQSPDQHSIRTNTLYFQESAQDSFVFTVVFCTLIFINLIRAAYMLYGALVVTLRTCYGAL